MKLLLFVLPGSIQILTFLLSTMASTAALGHGGGLDAYGCHHNRKAGGYHCHRGSLAGQSFASKDEMISHLNKKESPGTPKRRAKEQ